MILGIDTSLGTAVALVHAEGTVLAERGNDNPLGHAEVIGTYIADALQASASDPLTAVAAGMGPGPFTGLRVGIVAARALALARKVPVIPVPSHDGAALAELLEGAETGRDPGRFAIVTDARRREFAYTVYEGIDDDGLPIRVTEPALAPRDDTDARLQELGARRVDVTRISAAMIALCAVRATAARRSLMADEPLYLRAPDVVPPKPRVVR